MSTQIPDLEALTHAARLAAEHAYAPYSRFFVGAALQLETGETVTGCNVEVASYRLTCCAEQAAIAAAVSRFGPGVRVQAVVVVNRNGAACSPCGACRQTLAEFCDSSTPVAFPAADGRVEIRTIEELLPFAFSSAVLPTATASDQEKPRT